MNKWTRKFITSEKDYGFTHFKDAWGNGHCIVRESIPQEVKDYITQKNLELNCNCADKPLQVMTEKWNLSNPIQEDSDFYPVLKIDIDKLLYVWVRGLLVNKIYWDFVNHTIGYYDVKTYLNENKDYGYCIFYDESKNIVAAISPFKYNEIVYYPFSLVKQTFKLQ